MNREKTHSEKTRVFATQYALKLYYRGVVYHFFVKRRLNTYGENVKRGCKNVTNVIPNTGE